MNHEGNDSKGKGEKLLEELQKYALISAYLFICFAVILLYETSMRDGGAQPPTVPWSLALVKALVLGKFILIGDALSVGKRASRHPLLYRIAWKSVAMLIVLVLFKVLEELIVGWIHGSTTAQVFGDFLEKTWLQHWAPLLLMLLVLVPMITASEIYRAVGPKQFQNFLKQH